MTPDEVAREVVDMLDPFDRFFQALFMRIELKEEHRERNRKEAEG